MQAPTLALSQAESTRNDTAEHLPVEDQAWSAVLPPAECTEALAAAEAAFEAGLFDKALSGFRTALQVNDWVPVKSFVSDRKSEFVFVKHKLMYPWGTCAHWMSFTSYTHTPNVCICVYVCAYGMCVCANLCAQKL